MTVHAIAKEFVELCNQGKNFDVMKKFYDEHIVSVEAAGSETAGKSAVIQKSEKWGAANEIHGETAIGPYFNTVSETGGQFAVHFTFEVTPRATGQRTTLREVAVYTVTGDKITREQFFYEGNW